jgi:hypothetical protein
MIKSNNKQTRFAEPTGKANEMAENCLTFLRTQTAFKAFGKHFDQANLLINQIAQIDS